VQQRGTTHSHGNLLRSCATTALAVEGLHRTVKLGDLLIAAAAERAQLVVLHYDRDFDRIATITGQPTEWVAPSVTVDWGRAAWRWVRHQGVDSRLASNLGTVCRIRRCAGHAG